LNAWQRQQQKADPNKELIEYFRARRTRENPEVEHLHTSLAVSGITEFLRINSVQNW
jgi:hypothetical protein